MLNLIKELFSLLNKDQRKRFYSLQVLVTLMSIMEIVGIASIGPFMALVADIDLIHSNHIYSQLYQFTGFDNPQDFLFLTGVAVLILLAIASMISIVTTWRLSIFAYAVGAELADRLYKYYLNQDWLFHANSSSAQLIKQVSNETARVTAGIIQPFMLLNAKVILAFLISISILIYNPITAIAGLVIFLSGYIFVYKIVRSRISNNGRKISKTATNRYRLMNEGFGGIKDILLLNRNKYFINQFIKNSKIQANAQGYNVALSYTPRYFVELLAFGAIIILVLVLLKIHNGILSQVLPILAVYALAGFKLLPALQQMYTSITQIKGNVAAFESIRPDLIASKNQEYDTEQIAPLDLSNSKVIKLKNITFNYPGKQRPALDNINIDIPINSVIGLVGASGSGKSTAIDILLGLITPNQGQLLLDNLEINSKNKKAWQANIGFVPQSIFLGEGTIAENVAFGLGKEDIDMIQVEKAIKLANLDELVNNLPDGLNTKVGERGVRLSGGQRQRIGIARALYNESKILVFDEATSALDGITEKIIMEAIHQLSGQRTIVLIAHRLKTVRQCNIIYMLEKGKVIDSGSYDDLVTNNTKFKEMARYA